MGLDRNLKLAGSFLSFALIIGCAREPEVASTLGNDANTTVEILKDDERTDLSKLVLVAMQTQKSQIATDIKTVVVEIAGKRPDGSTLIRIIDSTKLVEGEPSVAEKLKQNLHAIQITPDGKIELINAEKPKEILLALATLSNNDLVAFSQKSQLGPEITHEIVSQINQYYANPTFETQRRLEGWKPKDPAELVQKHDKFTAAMQAEVSAENSTILASRRALTEKDTGVITFKSKDGLALHIDIGEITVMSRAEYLERRKNQPPMEKGDDRFHKVTNFGDRQRIDVFNSYLKMSESLVIVAGEMQLRKAEAVINSEGFMEFSPKPPRVVRSAPFPEFTAAVIENTEAGKIINNRKLLERIRDFICESQ